MRPATTTQSMHGDQGVQIGYADGATINVTYGGGGPRTVPLERATIPATPDAKSPARLIRARSGVVPFAARKGLRDELIEWLQGDAPFAGAVIGGSGGTGKTRLAVELCDWAEGEGWLSGILASIEDPASLEALADAPVPRLIAVDYSESRADQLKVLLPLLASRATPETPVRVLLLVRAGPKRTTDWTESLRNQSDLLDNLLDRCKTHVLETLPLNGAERAELFEAAAEVFAKRSETDAPTVPTALLESPAFKSPLLVVLAAYLAVHGDEAPPSTREELLRAVLLHEERYWRSSSGYIFGDESPPRRARRVIALATLLGAESEEEAVERLRLLTDLADAPAERLGVIARWAAERYPGPGWWNPLEPDLVGEQLVADEFSDQPAVLSGALAGETPRQLIGPLEVFGRAAGNHPKLAGALEPILSRELRRLCQIAVSQARDEGDSDLIYGKAATLATVLEKAIAAVELDGDALGSAHDTMPNHSNLLLNSLALALNVKLVERHRRPGKADAADPILAMALSNLSVRLAFVGRRAEGLVASEESVEAYRRLAAENPAVYEPQLAVALNNLSNRQSDAGRRTEALATVEESADVYRRLAAENPAAYEPHLAVALNNLSNRQSDAGRRTEALATIEESVEIRRRLAAENPAAYEPDLAGALNNLSNRLGDAGRRDEALAAVEESVEIRRRLAAENPAAYEPDLASALNNLAGRLAHRGRRTEALATIEESVEAYRRLATENPAAYEPDLASALNNLSNRLGDAGRRDEALAAVEESVEIRRRLADENPAAYEPDLASALNNLSNCLGDAGRRDEALAASSESVGAYRRLATENSAAYEPGFASALNNLSNCLGDAGRHTEALATIEESVEIRRRLADENPAAYEPDLAVGFNNLSNRLGDAGRRDEALAAIEESVEIRRRLAVENPAAHEPGLALALNNLSGRLGEVSRLEDAARVKREAEGLRGKYG
jgi:hypothetical protein